jgi:hypothetical protein
MECNVMLCYVMLLVTGFIRMDYSHDKLQSLETISSTALVVHLDKLLKQLLLSTGTSMDSSGTNWINSSSWSNLTARLLNSNSNYLPSLSENSICL